MRLIRRFFSSTRAFSIIEMAIVLGLIGILLAGVLGGRSLLKKAEISALKQNYTTYQSYITEFREKYRALPGDFRSAPKRLAARGDVRVLGGNGNGIIDSEQEQALFWQHLALADIMKGIAIEENPEVIFGETAPDARVGGGFNVVYEEVHGVRRHWFRLSQTPMAEVTEFDGVLTPLDAAQVDRDLDDGNPMTGSVVATGDACLDNKQYSTTKEKGCVLYFAF